jgi:cytochrome c biogenesis protein CcmG/thiol:disulfide interchange protein DsbE
MLLSITSCGEADNKVQMAKAAGEEFKPFSITSFDGNIIDTATMRGEVVVINFWASWCGPCKMEARDLEKVYRKYKGKGVRFVGIAVDDTLENARGFIARYGVTYPNAFDFENRLAAGYSIFAIPTTYVLDKEGLSTFTHRGAISKGRLIDAIERVR